MPETAWRESEVVVDTVLEGGREVDLSGAGCTALPVGFFHFGKRPDGALDGVFPALFLGVLAFLGVGLKRQI